MVTSTMLAGMEGVDFVGLITNARFAVQRLTGRKDDALISTTSVTSGGTSSERKGG
jgi:hypothetical protein